MTDKCKKVWTGSAELKATQEFDSVQSAADTNNPGKDAKISVLGFSWGFSNITLTKEKTDGVRSKKDGTTESEKGKGGAVNDKV